MTTAQKTQTAINRHIATQWTCTATSEPEARGSAYGLDDAEALLLEPLPKPRVKGMTYAKLYRSIRAGSGCGHCSEYKPWLRLRRKNPSPESNQVVTRIGATVKLAIFSSKPIDDRDAEVRWRTLERLELERRYAQEISAPYHISSSALVPILLAGQLEWWLGCATLALTPSLLPLAEPFAEEVMHRSNDSIAEAVCAAVDRLRIDLDSGWILFRHCAWTQAIDVDPSQKILTTYPMRPGGRKLRQNLQKSLFGESWL